MLAMPYLAGVRRPARRAAGAADVVDAAAIRGFCSGALSGALLGVLAAFSGGPLGEGRLSAVGPSAWQVMTVATLELGISAAVSAGAASWWYGRNGRIRPAPGTASGLTGRGERVRPEPATATRMTPSDADLTGERSGDGHVIYLDRWASDPKPATPPKRPAGPYTLP